MTSASLLGQLTVLARPDERADTAVALGKRLGGERLIVFICDHHVGELLPAPGFPQTLPGGRAWRAFLEQSVSAAEATTDCLLPPGGGPAVPAYGVSAGPDIVAVVLGAMKRAPEISELQALLPMVAAVFQAERTATHAQLEARQANEVALRAESLSDALDRTRGELQRAVEATSKANSALAELNGRLMQQAADLEAANHLLQEQATELEVQTEELEARATQLMESNEALDAARASADAANLAKSQFLTMMSHELRTPLNAIGGHVQLIQLGIHGAINAAQEEALRRVDRSQRHLLGLINNILNLARIESGQLDYLIETVGISEAIMGVQPMIAFQLDAKQLSFEVRITDPDMAVRADANKLQQILLNLLSNAVKFTGSGGSVSVDVLVEGDTREVVLVKVADSGMGIPGDRLDEIFEPFVRVNTRRTQKEEGTGLGLAISRDLARGMGGDLAVTSTLDVGSTFTLTLPRA